MQFVWNKKQSDVMRFTQRIRAWEYRHSHRMVRCEDFPELNFSELFEFFPCSLPRPTRTDKARRLGYKRKPGYVIWRVRVRRGGRKRPVPKGICYGKPKTAGVNHLMNAKNMRVIAEGRVGKHCGGLRVLNSYWVNAV